MFREDGMFYNELETRSVDAFLGHVLYILVWPTKLKGIKESLCSSVCLSLPLFIRLSWLVKETSAQTLNKVAYDMRIWLDLDSRSLYHQSWHLFKKALWRILILRGHLIFFSFEANNSFLLGRFLVVWLIKIFWGEITVICMSFVFLGWDWARGERQEEHKWQNLDWLSNTEKWMRER